MRSALDTEKLQQERLKDELQEEIVKARNVEAILGGNKNTLAEWKKE